MFCVRVWGLLLILSLAASASVNRLQLGAHINSDQVVFRVYSARATHIELNLFAKPMGTAEAGKLELTKDDATSVWSVTVPLTTIRSSFKITGTIYYGYRVWGPNWTFDAAWTKGSDKGFISDVDSEGNRFNPNKLLFDPYAHEISHDPQNATNQDGGVFASGADHRLTDSGLLAPKGIVLADSISAAAHLDTPLKDDIIYEVHLRGLSEADASIPARLRGTYAGAALKAPALRKLGVTAVEFLPLMEIQNDANDVSPGTADYWGYGTLNYFAPDRRYSSDKSPGGPTREIQKMIKAFHSAHLKVLVDVVYNHTGEGYAWKSDDPSIYNLISFRGFDNPAYYVLSGDRRFSFDNTGVGGDFNTADPIAQDLIVDSIGYWHNALGVDGFRFDLAPLLGNTCTQACFQFDKFAPSTAANRLAKEFPGMPLIAEPWALGDGTYQLGNFPAGWSDWNGKYRDTLRQSQNKLGGENVATASLATRFSGSSDLFENNGRKPWNSINFIDVHDGLTLNDIYSFNNGDGSWDQGGTRAAQIQAARTGFTLLMASAGTPLFVGGDEFLRSQNGNNNTYNIDTAANWLNYNLGTDQQAFQKFATTVLAFRNSHPALRPAEFYSSSQVQWFQPSGASADSGYFTNSDNHAIGWKIDGTSFGDPSPALFVGYNSWSGPVTFQLPNPPAGKTWMRAIDSALGNIPAAPATGTYYVPGRTAFILIAQ